MGKKGSFVLSLDTELAWGSFDKGLTMRQVNEFKMTRSCITRLLELLEKHRISATFAFTGHLMLSECHTENSIKHPDLVRPNHAWFKDDWFACDPATDIERDPIWYGKDILEQVKSAVPTHEIGSHSFSHIILGDAGCSPECAETDIAKCVEVAESNGIQLKSFVFPRNMEGYKDVLKKHRFQYYRGNGNEWYKRFKNKGLRKLLHMIDDFFALAPTTSEPSVDPNGMVNTIGNMLYLSRSGFRKYIPIRSRVVKAKRGIDLAVKRGETFHMWFHPFNLASDPDGLLRGLDEILTYARRKIDNDLLENDTIESLCRKALARR